MKPTVLRFKVMVCIYFSLRLSEAQPFKTKEGIIEEKSTKG